MKIFNFKKIFFIATLSVLTILLSSKKGNVSQGFIPKEGFVPNQAVAKKIAEDIWFPIYGNSIYEMKPFKVRFKGKDSLVWVVEGTLDKGKKSGVPYIEIQKKDCKVLKVSHGK